MSKDEIDAIVEEIRKATGKEPKGLLNIDRIVVAVLFSLVGALHWATPPDHDWIASKFDRFSTQLEEVASDLKLVQSTAQSQADLLKDHEERLRSLEHQSQSKAASSP